MAIIITPAKARKPHWQRGAVLLVASLLLHLLVFTWSEGRFGFSSLAADDTTPIATVTLTAPPPKPAPPQRALPRKVKPPPPAAPLHAAQGKTAPSEAVATSAPPADAPASEHIGAAGDAFVATAPASTEPASVEAVPDAAKRYKIAPPPSAVLAYDVQALRNGQNWHGNGVFEWEAANGSYRINGEASITLFFKIGVLNFKSEGAVTDIGITPVLYTEKPWRKSMTNTHFRHAERLISFSASEATYPYQGGEQDRASVIWQLAGIGRGDVAQFAPGAEFDIFVAGTRNADTWRIHVLGEEEIDTPYGRLVAWHVVRAPRPGTHDQQIDIWLAPRHDWYPAKVRYTYANGDHLDMSLSGIAPGTAR